MEKQTSLRWKTIYAALSLIFLLAGPSAAFEVHLSVSPGDRNLIKVLENVSLSVAASHEGATDSQDIQAAALADYSRLVGALYELGFYSPAVSILVDGREAATISSLAPPAKISHIKLVISTGPTYEFGRTEIAPLAVGTTIPDAFRTGSPAEISIIRGAALAGVDGWRAIGHAMARMGQQKVVADHRSAELDVELQLAPGPLAQFGEVNISGDSKVRVERIRQIAGIPKGEVFDPAVLERAATRLRRTGAFSSVALHEASVLEQNNTLDVDLGVVDAKPRRLGFGVEYQSTEGVMLSGFWMHRNLFGGAERLRIDGEISGLGATGSGLDYHLSAGLTRPSTLNVDSDLFVLGEIEQLDEPLYFSRNANLEVGFKRYFSQTLSGEASVSYRYSDVNDSLGSRQFTHLATPIAATWDKRDNRLNPTGGTFLRTEIMPYLGLGSSASGGRGYLDARAYRSFGENDNIVAAARLQFGTVLGSSLAQTPPDLLFLSGGSNTVRGHPYQSLSIASGFGNSGGRSFLGMAGELRLRISDKIGAVAFYDAGYVGANSWIDNTGSWHSGVGIGMRYQTGIGPIRLDIAAPVTGSKSSGIQLYLGIGQAF